MARLARVVVAGTPYHVTHRGNRRARVFLADEDREGYLAFLERYSRHHGLEIWAWCLMSNHVHLLVCPQASESLALTLGNAHGKYAQWLNGRHGLSGHVWANRFYSTPLDYEHMWAAVRYVELNPVRAGLIQAAERYEWSSAAFHCGMAPERNSGHGGLMRSECPFPGDIGEAKWAQWLAAGLDDATCQRLRGNTMTGRPCGGSDFVARLERELNRILRPQKVGRKPKHSSSVENTPDLFGGANN